jgi:hypothetical protein
MADETGESIHRYCKRAGPDRDMGLSHAHDIKQQRIARMEPPPPSSQGENPTSAPDASAALIIAVMLPLLSRAEPG